jgi:hypothetical protein
MKKLFQKIANAVAPGRARPAQDIVELDQPKLAVVTGGDQPATGVPRRRRGPTAI